MAKIASARQARAATSGMPVLKVPEPSAELHIGCQQMLVPGASFAERYDFLEANGYDRVEINGGNWEWLAKNADEMAAAIRNRRRRLSALEFLLDDPPGLLLFCCR